MTTRDGRLLRLAAITSENDRYLDPNRLYDNFCKCLNTSPMRALTRTVTVRFARRSSSHQQATTNHGVGKKSKKKLARCHVFGRSRNGNQNPSEVPSRNSTAESLENLELPYSLRHKACEFWYCGNAKTAIHGRALMG
jgi:hypothetical protein